MPQGLETSWLYFLGHSTHNYHQLIIYHKLSSILFFNMINFILNLSSNAPIITHKQPIYCIYLDVCVCFWKFSVGFCVCFIVDKITYYLQLYYSYKFHYVSLNINIELYPCWYILLLTTAYFSIVCPFCLCLFKINGLSFSSFLLTVMLQ